MAQMANERKLAKRIPPHKVKPWKVIQELKSLKDPLARDLDLLYVNVTGQPLPPDPYSNDGYLFRAYVYRHLVTHERRSPYNYGSGSRNSYWILVSRPQRSRTAPLRKS